VFNPDRKLRISAQDHHSKVDYNLYEGTEVEGAPETVLVRGQVVVQDRQLVAEPGAGRFVRRARVTQEQPVAPLV
jgi:dihydropyrimidinase